MKVHNIFLFFQQFWALRDTLNQPMTTRHCTEVLQELDVTKVTNRHMPPCAQRTLWQTVMRASTDPAFKLPLQVLQKRLYWKLFRHKKDS